MNTTNKKNSINILVVLRLKKESMAKQLLIYLEGNRGIFYGDDMPIMQQVDFPPDVVRDLDVLNKEKLNALIQACIDTYQLLPTTVTVILSSLITFDKDFSGFAADQQPNETQKFLDQVPFQNILPYRFTQQNKLQVTVANKDFVYAIKLALEKRGFTLTAVVALSILQELYPELQTNLNLDLILSKIDTIRQYSMLVTQTAMHSPVSPEKETNNTPDKKRLFLLLGIFGFLILFAIIFAVITLAPQKPVPPPAHIGPASQINIQQSQRQSNSMNNQPNPHTHAIAGISTHQPVPIFYSITVGK